MLTQRGETYPGAKTRNSPLPLPPAEIYEPGVHLTVQGRVAAHVYLVVNGVVKLAHVAEDGREGIVELASGGDLIGVHSALLKEECFETATTASECSVVRWRALEFLGRLETEAPFAAEVSRLVLRRLARLRYRVVELETNTARQRLVALLRFWPATDIPERANTLGGGFNLPLSREELGQWLSISEYHLCRLLKDLEKQRVIALAGHHIRVLPAARRTVAGHA